MASRRRRCCSCPSSSPSRRCVQVRASFRCPVSHHAFVRGILNWLAIGHCHTPHPRITLPWPGAAPATPLIVLPCPLTMPFNNLALSWRCPRAVLTMPLYCALNCLAWPPYPHRALFFALILPCPCLFPSSSFHHVRGRKLPSLCGMSLWPVWPLEQLLPLQLVRQLRWYVYLYHARGASAPALTSVFGGQMHAACGAGKYTPSGVCPYVCTACPAGTASSTGTVCACPGTSN